MEDTLDTGPDGSAPPKRRSAKKRGKKRSRSVPRTSDEHQLEGSTRNPKRSDPRPRRIDMIGIGPDVRKKDPDKHYVCANPADQQSGQAHYQRLGYTPVIYREGGVYIANALAVDEGQEITWKGEVLMECPLEEFEYRMEHGDGIAGGMALHRERMRQVNAPDIRGSSDARAANGYGQGTSSEKYFTIHRDMRVR